MCVAFPGRETVPIVASDKPDEEIAFLLYLPAPLIHARSAVGALHEAPASTTHLRRRTMQNIP